MQEIAAELLKKEGKQISEASRMDKTICQERQDARRLKEILRFMSDSKNSNTNRDVCDEGRLAIAGEIRNC